MKLNFFQRSHGVRHRPRGGGRGRQRHSDDDHSQQGGRRGKRRPSAGVDVVDKRHRHQQAYSSRFF